MDSNLQAALLERAKREKQRRARSRDTNMFEQTTSGAYEGIAALAGMPVDLMTAAVNAGTTGVNHLTGSNIPKIKNPAGGSQMFEGGMRRIGAISEAEPETLTQGIARSIGREMGAMAIPTGAAINKVTSVPKLLGFEAASATGAGLGTEAARQLMPESDVAEVIGGLAGGLSPFAAARVVRPPRTTASMETLRAHQAEKYNRVESSKSHITTESRNDLIDRLRNRATADDIDEFLHPKATRSLERMEALPANPTIHDVEQKRRLIGRDVAGATEAGERRLGVGMKEEIDQYLRGLEAADVVGPDASETVDALQEGRELTRRIAKAEDISGDVGAITKAVRRAATSGIGGNEINAIRQNIRAILDNPKRRRGYSKEEISLMEAIVEGTAATNTLRSLGRMSPTTGSLQQMAAGGLFTGAAMTNNPLFAVPPVTGYLAQAGAEQLTNHQIRSLDEMVRNGGIPTRVGASKEQMHALNAALLSRLSAATQQ